MGSNRNNQVVQNKSRLSNNDPGDCMEDSEGESSDEDKLREEPPDMRVYPEFLKNLPGVQASDSMGYRIEALRVYLEGQLGEEAFIAAYQHLNNLENDEDENAIEGIVGAKKMKFVPLIHHLIVCEDSYYTN
jgi:NIMA (never in mitosis gene a)-related kinase